MNMGQASQNPCSNGLVYFEPLRSVVTSPSIFFLFLRYHSSARYFRHCSSSRRTTLRSGTVNQSKSITWLSLSDYGVNYPPEVNQRLNNKYCNDCSESLPEVLPIVVLSLRGLCSICIS